jgi:hypothetical protein
MGFCLEDSFCPPDKQGKHNCEWQGITAGCGDLYYAGLACQWIDVTDVVSSPSFDPKSLMTLSIHINHAESFPEHNYTNNIALVPVVYADLEVRNTNKWSKPRHGPVPPKCAARGPEGNE